MRGGKWSCEYLVIEIKKELYSNNLLLKLVLNIFFKDYSNVLRN